PQLFEDPVYPLGFSRRYAHAAADLVGGSRLGDMLPALPPAGPAQLLAQLLAGLESQALAGPYGPGCARLMFAPLARRPRGEGEAPEARHLGALSCLDRLGDGRK